MGSPCLNSLSFKQFIQKTWQVWFCSSINTVSHDNMSVARIFQRGGHTESYIGSSPDCHLNIVGCLLTKRLTKGGGWGHGHPRTPMAAPLHNLQHRRMGRENQSSENKIHKYLSWCERLDRSWLILAWIMDIFKYRKNNKQRIVKHFRRISFPSQWAEQAGCPISHTCNPLLTPRLELQNYNQTSTSR